MAVLSPEECEANGNIVYDNGAACVYDTIFMGRFNDQDLELAAFFHELGHIVSRKRMDLKQQSWMCTISNEAVAWEVGRSLAIEHGFKWDYHGKEMVYARQQLKGYADTNCRSDNPNGNWGLPPD